MKKLQFKDPKKNYFILKICGDIKIPNYDTKYETLVREMKYEDWKDVDTLFFSYISKGCSHSFFSDQTRNYEKNNNLPHYGTNFKYSVIGPYLGWWCQGDIDYDYIDLKWDDICSVQVQYVNEKGEIKDVELLDVDKEYVTEEEFMKAFVKASNERSSEMEYKETSEGIYLKPWDLPLARKILIHNGWDKEEVNNMFYINSYMGFAVIKDNNVPSFIGTKAIDSLNSIIKQATDDTGKSYTGFSDETYLQIKEVINNSNLSDIVKQVTLSALKVYNGIKFPDVWVVNSTKKDLIEINKINGLDFSTCGPEKYTGIYISKVTEKSKSSLEYYERNQILTYNEEIYTIHEVD